MIEIKSGENNRSTYIALKHAFGHILGLTHCDRPYYLMLKNCEKGNLTDYKNINDKDIAWRTSSLSVYIDGNKNFHTHVKRALDYYERGAEGWAPKDLSFNIVEDRFSADIIIEFNSSACGNTIYLERYNNKVCYNNINARDYDSDKNIEYYTSIVVRIRTTDINVIDWYVGYGLGFALGAENEDELPEPFVNSDYNDASGLWWE